MANKLLFVIRRTTKISRYVDKRACNVPYIAWVITPSMKTKAKFLLCFAATCFAFVGAIHAQVLTDYQTVQPEVGPPAVSGYSGSVSSFNGTTRASQGQIFTNVLAIDSMTYNLFTTGSPQATTLTATFGQWDTTLNAFTGPTLSLGSFLVPTIGGWDSISIAGDDPIATFEISLDVTAANGGNLYTTNQNLSYAVMLTQVDGFGVSGSRGFGIGKTDGEADFLYGKGGLISNGGAYSNAGADYTFSQIAITPYVAPTPESGTVAALVGAALVAGLVGFRLRQRRQPALAPAATA